MFKNYFKIAWRNLWKNRASSLINIIGLSTGMMCFIVILIYVKNEMSFDRYHVNADRIYRVVKDFVNTDGTKIPDATTPPALSYSLKTELPEVEYATRFSPSGGRKYLIRYQDKAFYETSLMRVDSNFLHVFDFPFAMGNRESAFKGPLSIVLTQTAANKYFGDINPIGKMVRININNGQDFLITGVLKDVPQNSHYTFDFLIPFTSGRDSVINSDWSWHIFYTYVLLKPNANVASFLSKLQPLFSKHQPQNKDRYYAQALTSIHLTSNLKWEIGANGDMNYINILMLIAIFVVVIAGINYINLITAQSVKRAREVGVRKVAGASKQSLVLQFLTESVCTVLVSFAVSIFAVSLLLPYVNRLMDRNLSLFSASQLMLWIQLTGIILLIGIIAGLYPAFQLSSFQPVKVLKGKFIASWRGAYLRKSLVVFQFLISILLIISFFTIYRQVDFITEKNLGFDKYNILMMPNVRNTGLQVAAAPGSWLDDLKKIPAVTNVARADGIFGEGNSTNGIAAKGGNNHISLNFIRIDHEFVPTFKIELIEGRNFLNSSHEDSASIILNETAIAQLGLQKPYIGQQLEWDDEAGEKHPVNIVGIVKDFHFTSMHEAIKPFGFISEEGNGSTFFIKLHSTNLAKDIAAVGRAWSSHNPDKPFQYSFQDEQLSKLYQSDIRFKNLFSYITVLAIVIACLGLLGLSIFTAEARTKEIGIRKVLGASATFLFTLLSKDFILLVAIAALMASPLAWWAMHSWLQSFAYRVNIGWEVFIAAGLTAIFITLLTVSYHAIKAAIANPVKSLRTE